MLLRMCYLNVYQAVMSFCFLWSAQGQSVTTVLSSSMKESVVINYKTVSNQDLETSDFTSKPSEISSSSNDLWSLNSAPKQLATAYLSYSPEASLTENTRGIHSNHILSSSIPEIQNSLLSESSAMRYEHLASSKFHVESSHSFSSNIFPSPSLPEIYNDMREPSVITRNSSVYGGSKVSSSNQNYPAVASTSSYLHFHTPLMSLLIASSSITFHQESLLSTTTFDSNMFPHSLIIKPSDNESINPDLSSVPPDVEHKKLLMLVLRAEDCSRFSKSDFEKMLGKLMAKFGFGDVVPEVSNAKCYSHLNINVTVGGSAPTLRFLPNIDGKNNFTVDVLNRTFRIVKLEKVDLRLEKTKSSNFSSNIISAVAKHESIAYIAVGVSFGLVLVICVFVCCIKCCCLRKPPKRFGAPKSTHVRLRPEDYTLTPIPRPTSLYVDYYRGSVTADIYSTTSAGSLASTTPTVEQGVVQPFDTSIVPLEDSSALPLDSSRDPSVESVPVQSDLKTFNIHGLAGKGSRSSATDSKEQLNPKQHSKKVEFKQSGVANPTFQRY